MSKLQDREARRKSAVAGLIGGSPRPDERPDHRPAGMTAGTEPKKRVSLSVRPSLYEDVQRIAYVQRKSVSQVVGELMEEYRERYRDALEEYEKLKG